MVSLLALTAVGALALGFVLAVAAIRHAASLSPNKTGAPSSVIANDAAGPEIPCSRCGSRIPVVECYPLPVQLGGEVACAACFERARLYLVRCLQDRFTEELVH
jgi:DNA-directed RNA polymerase subunit RPC12/RpoP